MSNKKSFIVVGVSVFIIIILIVISVLANQNQENSVANSNTQEAPNEISQESQANPESSTNQEDQTSLPTQKTDPSIKIRKSGYIDYKTIESVELSPDSRKVLFFHASWCPSCRSLDKSLNEKDFQDVDGDIVVIKVDYDKEDELKTKYKIPSQHTLVEVDQNWNELKKFTGANNLKDISQKLN